MNAPKPVPRPCVICRAPIGPKRVQTCTAACHDALTLPRRDRTAGRDAWRLIVHADIETVLGRQARRSA